MINKQETKHEERSIIRGQSLFEVTFALAIASIILVSIVALTATSIRNSTFSKNSITATQLAQQATEWIRGQRDTDWPTFVARATSGGRQWCLSDLSWPTSFGACGPNVGSTVFKRSVTLKTADIDGDSITDTVDTDIVVIWNDAQGQHESKNHARFTNWRR